MTGRIETRSLRIPSPSPVKMHILQSIDMRDRVGCDISVNRIRNICFPRRIVEQNIVAAIRCSAVLEQYAIYAIVGGIGGIDPYFFQIFTSVNSAVVIEGTNGGRKRQAPNAEYITMPASRR